MTLYILNSVTGSYGEYNHHAVGIFTDREVAENWLRKAPGIHTSTC